MPPESAQGSWRAAARRRGFAIADVPGVTAAFVLAVDLVVAAIALPVLAGWRFDARDLAVFTLLAVLAVGFEEGSAFVGRLHWRLSTGMKRDMGSVWTVAAAVALSPAAAVALIVVFFVYLWLRHHHRNGQPLHRMWFSMSSVVLGVLAAGRTADAVTSQWPHLAWGTTTSIAVLAAILVATVVNRSLVTIVLLSVGVRGDVLMGTRDENLTEFSTLCLGGLVAVAAIHEPWLCVLVVLPMVALQRASVVRELEAAAITDAKTGLLNAVAWEQLARRELARATRERTPIAILIVDIDRFKRVNDRYGHLVGDQVLRGLGRCLTAALREYDGLGRFGGEEFVAVLPDAGETDALIVAERVRERVNALTVAEFVGDLPAGIAPVDSDERLSVSIGVCIMRDPADELAALLHAADRALYRAKDNGRNQVQLAGRDDGVAAPEAAGPVAS